MSSPHKLTKIKINSPEEHSGPILYQQTCQNPNCWIELSRASFNQNISSIKAHIGTQKSIAAVLKSNAYGHGLIPVGQLCQENNHITYLVVFLLSDALTLRQNGVSKPILVLGGYDMPIEDAIRHSITLTVYDWQTAKLITAKAQELRQQTAVHLKIDSGLSRLGFLPQEALQIVEFLTKKPYIKITGIYTHFAESDSHDLTFTNSQLDRFTAVLQELHAHNITIPYIHLANTAAMLRFKNTHGTMIRCGGALYGTYKKPEFYQQSQTETPGFSLASFLTIKSRIIAIKKIPENIPVGYACTYKTTRPTTLAIVPIGYFDGYDRRLSNNSFMSIGNQLAPVLGRIAMNMTTLDITDIPQAQIGTEVTVMGNFPEIRVQDIAQRINTIEYDIFTHLNPALARIIV